MKQKRAYRYRFYPTKEQVHLLNRTFGCMRYVYNFALRLRTDSYQQQQERLRYEDASTALTRLKQQPATAWLNEVPCVSLQQALRNLDKAFENFFLETRLERLQTWAQTERKGTEMLVLTDIGSGLKAGRRHLQRLLKLGCEDKVAEVAITYEDHLTRFGQEILETLFSCFDVTPTVLEPGDEKTPEQELTDDLLTLIASFSDRLYGCVLTNRRNFCNAR